MAVAAAPTASFPITSTAQSNSPNANINENSPSSSSSSSSCTIQSLLQTAKKLADRLCEHENNVEHIISQTEQLNKNIVSMRTYKDEVDIINENNRHKPTKARSQLIKSIQYENRQIRSLQKENEELKLALEEHQNAMEMIMSKYREHVAMLTQYAKLDFSSLNNVYQTELEQKNAKILEMVAVMQQVVRLDENSAYSSEKRIAQLENENRTLRELLFVSKQFQSLIRLVSSNPHALTSSFFNHHTAQQLHQQAAQSPSNSSMDSKSNAEDGYDDAEDDNHQLSPNHTTDSKKLVQNYPTNTVKKRPSSNSGGMASSNHNNGNHYNSLEISTKQGDCPNSREESIATPVEVGFNGNMNGYASHMDTSESDYDASISLNNSVSGSLSSLNSTNGSIASEGCLTNGSEYKRNVGVNNKAASYDDANGAVISNCGYNGMPPPHSGPVMMKHRYGSETDIISDTDSDSSSNASTVTLTPCTSDREDDENDDEDACGNMVVPLAQSLVISSNDSSSPNSIVEDQFSKVAAAVNCLPNGCIPDFHNSSSTAAALNAVNSGDASDVSFTPENELNSFSGTINATGANNSLSNGIA